MQISERDLGKLDVKIEILAEKLAPVYKLLNWEWFGKGVPTEGDIKDNLHRLLDKIKGGAIEACSGGLYVRAHEDHLAGISSIEMGMKIQESLYDVR